LGFLIGIAGAVVLGAGCTSFDGDSGRPAGDATEDGKMKSSRFMASAWGDWACWLLWSLCCLNCAMPLGALRCGATGAVDEGTDGGGSMEFVGLDLYEKTK
jgi:hypothetical protein